MKRPLRGAALCALIAFLPSTALAGDRVARLLPTAEAPPAPGASLLGGVIALPVQKAWQALTIRLPEQAYSILPRPRAMLSLALARLRSATDRANPGFDGHPIASAMLPRLEIPWSIREAAYRLPQPRGMARRRSASELMLTFSVGGKNGDAAALNIDGGIAGAMWRAIPKE